MYCHYLWYFILKIQIILGGTYSQYLQSKVFKIDILSAAQLWTTWCSFTEIIYAFKLSVESLYLKKFNPLLVKIHANFSKTLDVLERLCFYKIYHVFSFFLIT